MTVSLKQIAYRQYCNSQPNPSPLPSQNQFNRAVIINLNGVEVLFNYIPQNATTPILTDIILNERFNGAPAYLYNTKSTVIWFDGFIVTGGYVNSSSCQSTFYCSNFNCSCNVLPTTLESITAGLIDIAINYEAGDVYLYHVASNKSSAVIISIPIKELYTLLSNLKFPSSWKIIYATPSNAPNNFSLIDGSMIFYNNTFYITGIDGSGNLYLWVFNLSQVSFSTSVPNSPSSVGQLITIYSNGNANNGILFLNTIVNNNTFTYEILLYFTVNTDAGNNLYIYSINPSTLTLSLLFELQDVEVSQKAIYVNGLIAWITFLSPSSYALSVYARKTQSYEQVQIPDPIYPCANSHVTVAFVSEPAYVVLLQTGPGTNYTYNIIVYQILTDVTPQIQNLQYLNGYITGQVINLTDNQPLSGITVYLILLDTQSDNYVAGKIIASATTDSNGNFSIPVTVGGYMAVYVA